MQNNFKGLIKNIELKETVSYESDNLGTCWIIHDNGAVNRELMNNFIHGGERNIIVASEKKELLNHLINMVDAAKEIICLSTFLIQKSGLTDALLRASTRDVRVYLLTAREDDLIKAPDELKEWDTKIIEEHKDLLDSFAGKILVRTSPHFHAKFMLVDPKSQFLQGLVMTCNATVDAMCGNNMEIAATLTPSEIASYFSQFIRGFWEEAKHELLKKGELDAVKDTAFAKNSGNITHPSTCFHEHSLKEEIIKLIENTHKKLIITGWSFDGNHEVVMELLSALERGVKVSIYTKPSFRNTQALMDLLKNGAEINGHERYHAKLIISDGDYGLITTSNYTKKGLDEGFEVSVVLGKKDARLVQNIIDYWGSECEWRLSPEILLRDAPKKVKQYIPAINDLKEFEVQHSFPKEVPQYAPDSIEKILDYTIDTSKYGGFKNGEGILYKAMIVNQKVIPPKLPANTELLNEVKGPYLLYSGGKKGKARFVVVKDWDDVEKAKPFAKAHNAAMVIK